MSRPKIEILCQNCNKLFLKDRREYNRRIREGHDKFFCSRNCSTSNGNKTKIIRRHDLTKYNRSKLDEFSPFREILRRCKKRYKHEFNLTVEYIKSLWENQSGKCYFTHTPLLLPVSNHKQKQNYNYLASIDRVDNTKGYIEGNVRFVSVTTNYLRNTMTDEQVYQFLSICKNID